LKKLIEKNFQRIFKWISKGERGGFSVCT